MAGMYGYSREAIRVKVKKCEPNVPAEWRKFSVDPQITSLEVLCSILAKAFDVKSEFTISYKTLNPSGQETFLGVLSDWDLEAAFLRAHNLSIQTGNEPCLNLKIDIKAFAEANEWEVNVPTKEISTFQQSLGVGQKYVQTMQNKLPLIMNRMEKTFSMMQKVLNLSEDQTIAYPPRPPLSDSEFRNFQDSVGQIMQPDELRRVIFAGGIDPSLRKVVWKHILNVYPKGMTGKERMDYMRRKAFDYCRLRDVWKVAVQQGPVVGELAYVTSMVRKDVLRTDRMHPFYAGNDDNQNIASLFNILTTYALNHPSVSYCQGMSDIASPLLVTMGDEAHAYICFCAIMSRLKVNFMLDGIAMTQKFTHLAGALQFYDPEFYNYLKVHQADDLLFCYRWLLLELKREFAFEDSLRMLEVLWSSLKCEPLLGELELYEKEFEPPPLNVPLPKSPSVVYRTPRENHYTKVCALRRQSSSLSLLSTSPNQINQLTLLNSKLNGTKRINLSLDENISRLPRSKSVMKAHQSLDEAKMIKIMESAAQLEKDLTQSNDKLPVESEPNQIIETNQSKIIFHPTNPFCDAIEMEKNLTADANDNDINNDKAQINQKNTISNNNVVSKQLISNKKSSHFKDLKEKIAASKMGMLTSFDKFELNGISNRTQTSETEEVSRENVGEQKLVKNFNEFVHFGSITKNMISDKIIANNNKLNLTLNKVNKDKPTMQQSRPEIKLIHGKSLDDSDSSLVDSSDKSEDPNQLNSAVYIQTQQSLDGISPDDSQDYYPMTTSMTREIRIDLESLDRHVFGSSPRSFTKSELLLKDSEIEYEKLDRNSLDMVEVPGEEIISCSDINNLIKMRNLDKNNDDPTKRISIMSANSNNTEVFVWENPLHQLSNASSCNFNDIDDKKVEIKMGSMTTPDEQQDLEFDGDLIEYSGDEQKKSVTPIKLVQNIRSQDNSDSESPEMWKSSFSSRNPFISINSINEVADQISPEINSLEIPITKTTDFTNTTMTNSQVGEEAAETNACYTKIRNALPPPNEFGGGNPFLMFLCLTLLLQHRNYVIKNSMDYNEMAMHFDKMIRKHDVNRVLNQARRMYFEYLKMQSTTPRTSSS